jgi:hypothetical protein
VRDVSDAPTNVIVAKPMRPSTLLPLPTGCHHRWRDSATSNAGTPSAPVGPVSPFAAMPSRYDVPLVIVAVPTVNWYSAMAPAGEVIGPGQPVGALVVFVTTPAEVA